MTNSIDDYIQQQDWRVKENSNTNYSIQGLYNYISGLMVSDYWMKQYSDEVAQAHKSGDFHIHDADYLMPYCCGWSLEDLIKNGFQGPANKNSAAPAKHFRVILGQIYNFLYTLQGEAAGAQAFSNFDTLVAPFIAYDNLTYDEVKQAMQEFIFNLNVSTRVGAQTPFSNITMDLQCPAILADQPVVIGGQYVALDADGELDLADSYDKELLTYSQFQEEMDMVNRAFCEVMSEGDANGRVFSFPIPTYNLTKDFDWDNKNLDAFWSMTGKYGIPYFANYINSDMSPDDSRSMAILGTEKVIFREPGGRVTINEIRHLVSRWIASDVKPNYEILCNGVFVPIIDMFEVCYRDYDRYTKFTLANGYTQNFSYQHTCPIVRDGVRMEVESQEVQEGDSFLVSKYGYEGEALAGTYRSGKVLGYFLAEGWVNTHSSSEISFAININKKNIVDDITDFFNNIGCVVKTEVQLDRNIYKINVYGKQAVGFVRQYVKGKTAKKKRLEYVIWNTSKAFREGVFSGYYETDGSKKYEIFAHTTNKELIGDLIILANSIGKVLKYRKNNKNTRYFNKDKSDKVCFTSYELKEYTADEFEDYYTIPVTKIEYPKSKTDVVYNFTVDTKDHLYELPNGIVTHQCCRLRISNTELRKRGGGLFGAHPLTGSIGVVTINLPRLGAMATNETELFDGLEKLLQLAKESLITKRNIIDELTDRGLYPYSSYYLRDVKERFGSCWANHFNTIGFIGGNECCLNFMGEDITSEAGRKLMLDIMDYCNNRLVAFQKETGLLFNLEATPGESTCYKLALADGGVYDYYTNSTHLPVNYTDDVFEALSLQDDFQTKYTGGTVLHLFCGEEISDIKTVKNLVRNVAQNFKLPYFSITPTFSVCATHGYIKGAEYTCPDCDSETEVYSRIVGLTNRPN